MARDIPPGAAALGYLDHFASAVKSQDGVLTVAGKRPKNDTTAKATCVQVGGYLTDDWPMKNNAAEFQGAEAGHRQVSAGVPPGGSPTRSTCECGAPTRPAMAAN